MSEKCSTCRKWVMKHYFDGYPKKEDLELVEEKLAPLQDGEFLCEAVWLSVDPYMRPYSKRFPLGSTMVGEQVARVIATKNIGYTVGELVSGMFGWATHTIMDDTRFTSVKGYKVNPSLEPLSYALGILGMPGATAYFGLLEICAPKKGETVVVNGAAGAVGSVVGQIAKIKGCKVVGFAGSDAKVEYLRSIGFDAAFNYKTISSLKDTLKEACPEGIDIFFDNVGGEFHSTVVSLMNVFGRVSVCGAISEYNMKEPTLVRSTMSTLIFQQIKVEGFIVTRWPKKQWNEAHKEIGIWIKEGKIKYREHVTNGFDNMFDAFLGLFRGDNVGKAVVKA